MKKKIAVFLFLLLVFFIAKTLYQAGTFKTIVSHTRLTDISIYSELAGTEDLAIDPTQGLLFISSTDRWQTSADSNQKDGIYLLDLNLNDQMDTMPRYLPNTFQGEFHPHGISFLSKDDGDYLFVVNHNSEGNFVELFRFENDQLTHLKTFSDTQMCCPNDVVAVDVDKFYVSNDHGSPNARAKMFEDYLRLANSYILYFDGEQFSKVYQDLSYANGVEVSAERNLLYVTEVSGRKISVLDRDTASGELSLRFIKNLGTGPDNITVDANGDLWIGSHPKLLDFVGHSKNTGKPSPSQVLKLTAIDNDGRGISDFGIEEVYLNSGEQLSGSSVALHYQGQVFIGVVFENKLLRGTLSY